MSDFEPQRHMPDVVPKRPLTMRFVLDEFIKSQHSKPEVPAKSQKRICEIEHDEDILIRDKKRRFD